MVKYEARPELETRPFCPSSVVALQLASMSHNNEPTACAFAQGSFARGFLEESTKSRLSEPGDSRRDPMRALCGFTGQVAAFGRGAITRCVPLAADKFRKYSIPQ